MLLLSRTTRGHHRGQQEQGVGKLQHQQLLAEAILSFQTSFNLLLLLLLLLRRPATNSAAVVGDRQRRPTRRA
jgi:hypothetical protein